MENKNGLKILAIVVLLVIVSYISWSVGKSGGLGTSGGAALPAPGPIPGGIRGFGGTVENVSDSGFTLRLSAYDPLASQGPSLRNVAVNTETILERLIQKDNATIQKEQTAFMEKISAGGAAPAGGQGSASGGENQSEPLTPPEPFIREKISLNDIKAGDMVLVSAGEDIATAKQFIATRVSLQPSVSLPGTASSPTAPAAQPN